MGTSLEGDSSTEQSVCMILDKLPAEIRNTIRALSFATSSTSQPVELAEAAPPSNALLLTCKQINGKARGIYLDTYRDYWRTTVFRLTIDDSTRDLLASVGYSNVDQITQLETHYQWPHVRAPTVNFDVTIFNSEGGWELMDVSKDGNGVCTYLTYMPIDRRGESCFMELLCKTDEEVTRLVEQVVHGVHLSDVVLWRALMWEQHMKCVRNRRERLSDHAA